MYSRLFEQIYAKTHLYFHIGSIKGKLQPTYQINPSEPPAFFVSRNLSFMDKYIDYLKNETDKDIRYLYILKPKKVLKIFNVLSKTDADNLKDYIYSHTEDYVGEYWQKEDIRIVDKAINNKAGWRQIEGLAKQIKESGFDGFMTSEKNFIGNIGVFEPNECFEIIDQLDWVDIQNKSGEDYKKWKEQYEPLINENKYFYDYGQETKNLFSNKSEKISNHKRLDIINRLITKWLQKYDPVENYLKGVNHKWPKYLKQYRKKKVMEDINWIISMVQWELKLKRKRPVKPSEIEDIKNKVHFILYSKELSRHDIINL